MSRRPIRRALLSVHDKTGLLDLGRGLAAAGVQIVSTGATAGELAAAGVPVTPVEQVTGFPECLDGRVKTLHPHVHAALLADPDRDQHRRELARLGVQPFDLLVVNLYPFRRTVAAGADEAQAVEQIDVGGPAMVRAAAKNYRSVAVVVDPAGYPELLAAVHAGGYDLPARRELAAAAFAHTAAYDATVARWFHQGEQFPAFLGLALHRAETLRYGENPHQRAARYLDPDAPPGVAGARLLQGKPMSYNNYVDADAALNTAYTFDEPAVAVVKHVNPAGVAVATDVAAAHRKAHAGDPVSAFGGVIGANRPVNETMARQVAEVFTEVVVAPDFEPAARAVLSGKPAVRLLACPVPVPPVTGLRQIGGGWLAQTPDRLDAPGDQPAGWTLRAGAPADPGTLADLWFAWRAVRAVRSNAVLLATDRASVGVGMGQVNRVDAARLAVTRAGDRAAGAVAASDAYFPFPDGLQVLADAGVRAVVAPGGSIRDEQVVAAAAAAGLTYYLTAVRHFTH